MICPSKTSTNAPKLTLFPLSVGTHQAVGTFSGHYDYVYKDIFKDVPTVPSVPTILKGTRVSEDEKQNPSSFLNRLGVVLRQSAPHKTTLEPSCRTCARLRRPGLSDGYCVGA
jgi:hypothetical protein